MWRCESGMPTSAWIHRTGVALKALKTNLKQRLLTLCSSSPIPFQKKKWGCRGGLPFWAATCDSWADDSSVEQP